MESSIALPTAILAEATYTPVRAFIPSEDGFIEVTAPPFCMHTFRDMMFTQWYFDQVAGVRHEWSALLFFPEAWPPGLIQDYLRSHTWQGQLPGLELC